VSFEIILQDPPWEYADRRLIRKDGKMAKRGIGASTIYRVMKLDDLCALPMFNVAAKNCALHIWVTAPHQEACFQMVRAWNENEEARLRASGHRMRKCDRFLYKTKAFTWVKRCKNSDKPFFGNGYYYKANPEDCLLFIRGKVTPISDSVPQLIIEPHPRGEDGKIIHSRKPACARERIVQCFGELPRLEMFATEETPGWLATGYSVDQVDIRDFLARHGETELKGAAA